MSKPDYKYKPVVEEYDTKIFDLLAAQLYLFIVTNTMSKTCCVVNCGKIGDFYKAFPNAKVEIKNQFGGFPNFIKEYGMYHNIPILHNLRSYNNTPIPILLITPPNHTIDDILHLEFASSLTNVPQYWFALALPKYSLSEKIERVCVMIIDIIKLDSDIQAGM